MEFSTFRKFDNELFHTITDRFGGVSQAPFESLNLALHVGDKPFDVLKNREILSEKHNFILQNLIYMDQIHSANIAIIKDSSLNKIENCDALITDVKNIPLMVMVADCVPILFYDPVKKVIAVAHAGRNGTFMQIAKKTVLKMKDEYGSTLSDLKVGIGVSIGSCCYEVGKDLANICQKNFGKKYVKTRDDKTFLDLKSLNKDQLLDVGVKEENIEISSICSCCDLNYFSYRRDGQTGRFAGLMILK
ncbi:MAG: peptidoglycan editing factor PgeF [Epsilonproteobacteria bacterium]|nr:peptidoglycan editing factor PgeF [Campylobacterota bacterium]